MTEREKMLRGELYDATDADLVERRTRARRLMYQFNNSLYPSSREETLRELLGTLEQGAYIEPPFFCDYGSHIHMGAGSYVNMNCVFLDPAEIRIGAGTMLGPAVQLLTASHPLDAETRVKGPELAFPITIGKRVWIGGGAIVLPGVTIGDDTTIGAGSVVTKSIPAGVVAAGNPCRVIRELR